MRKFNLSDMTENWRLGPYKMIQFLLIINESIYPKFTTQNILRLPGNFPTVTNKHRSPLLKLRGRHN